jgi:hypothetical protein
MSPPAHPKYAPVRFGDHHYFIMEEDTKHSVTCGRFTDLQWNPVPVPQGVVCYDLVSGARQRLPVREGEWILYHMNDMSHNHKFDIYIEGSEGYGPVITLRPRVGVTFLSPATVQRNPGYRMAA